MLLIGHDEVRRLLAGREAQTIDVVRDAYEAHDAGASALPYSTFLRLPGDTRNRIIGLPAYIAGAQPAAGMKWIASFPGNVDVGLPRANAVIVLNSLATGQPEAMLEASMISAWRTAASAALAARTLAAAPPTGLSLIGAGVINREVLRFVRTVWPGLSAVTVHDLVSGRAEALADQVRAADPALTVGLAGTAEEALAAHPLVSIATSAGQPHLGLSAAVPDSTVLHLSLRDLDPDSILMAHNVVDDPDHACRERTSLHLTELRTGDREFINGSLGALLRSGAPVRRSGRPVVFSPFGLGVLDIALARLVRAEAEAAGAGTRIADFLPPAAPVTAAVGS